MRNSVLFEEKEQIIHRNRIHNQSKQETGTRKQRESQKNISGPWTDHNKTNGMKPISI